MYNSVFSSAGADPIWLQHLTWQLSHPVFWFVLLKWSLVFVGVVLVANQLLKANRLVLLGLFLFAVIVGIWGIYELSQEAAQSFREGRGNQIILLRVVGLFTDILAILVAIRVFYTSFLKRL